VGPFLSLVVATGGARGVTAAALRQLAAEHKPRLVLIGQTSLDEDAEELRAAADEPALIRLLAAREPRPPAEVAAQARRVLAAREVKANLAGFERAGATVRYVTADTRDAEALADALDEVRRDWGPITGIVHGAGVVADARLEEKTDAQFDRVLSTKVDGLRALLAATRGDPLTLLCAFSSVASVAATRARPTTRWRTRCSTACSPTSSDAVPTAWCGRSRGGRGRAGWSPRPWPNGSAIGAYRSSTWPPARTRSCGNSTNRTASWRC
jgi:NAD(P)-dependent dehydrogenase (short-subunit alcohol dehydrogenase family)